MTRVMVLAMLLSLIARAQSATETLQESGNAFLRQCSAVEKDRDLNTADKAHQMSCAAYVSGFAEGVAFASDSLQPKTPVYCPSEGIEAGQLVRIVLKYIRDYPEAAHLRTVTLVGRSFKKAFPC
jgi:Rap1a immunity proteins